MSAAFPSTDRCLFVVEQEGKIRPLSLLLRQVGVADFRVHSTSGALFDLPEKAIAISPITLLVTGYEVRHRPVAERLKELTAHAARIYVMTDADREGELIAAQVRQLSPGKPLLRLRLRALTYEALKEALNNPGKIDVGAATASAARRIVDRIIGFGFSDERRKPIGTVGRVLTPALSAFDRKPVACGEWTGKLGDLDARGVITNRTVADAKRIEVILHHAGHEVARLPREIVRSLIVPPRPCNCADAILEGRRRLGMATSEADKHLQRHYRAGRLSYTRSDSTHLGDQSRQLAMKMARAAHVQIAPDVDLIHLKPEGAGRKYAHEALHPTFPIDVSLDPSSQQPPDGLLSLIARRLTISVAAPVEIERERILPAALKSFLVDRLGESVSNVDFQLSRDITLQPQWMQWLKRAEYSGLAKVEYFGADATALSFLAGSNFGRPSSQIHFVGTLLKRGFIDELGNVTSTGQEALSYARQFAPFLLDHARIERVEQLLDQNLSSSVPELLNRLCEAMGIPVELAQSAVAGWYISRNIALPKPPFAMTPRPVNTAAQRSLVD